MIRGLRAAPLLFGRRGSRPADTGALADILVRVSRLADDLPEVAELDLNPVIARPDGACATDARVRVTAAEHTDPFLRRLRYHRERAGRWPRAVFRPPGDDFWSRRAGTRGPPGGDPAGGWPASQAGHAAGPASYRDTETEEQQMPAPEQAGGPRIVAGVDGSPSSLSALRWAVVQAGLTGASVDAVIAWHYPASAAGGGYGMTAGIAGPADFQESAEKIVADAISRIPDRPETCACMPASPRATPPGSCSTPRTALSCWWWAAAGTAASPRRCSAR